MVTPKMRTPGWGPLCASAMVALALFATACSKADPPLGPTANSPTRLTVTAIDEQGHAVDSAEVFFDGTQVGSTPYSAENIEPGLHSVRVSREGFRVFTNQLVAIQGQRYAVEALLTQIAPSEGQLVVSVSTDSVRVLVRKNVTDVVIDTFDRVSAHLLPPGMYTVSGEKAGYPTVEETVEIFASQTTTVFLQLQTPQTPPTLDFAIAEDTVRVGQAINLDWQSNGVRVIIDQGIGVRGPNGSERVVCSTPGRKIFTATAFSAQNVPTAKKDTVYVLSEDVQPPTLTFAISRDTVDVGATFELTWESNGHQVIIDQGVGTRGPSGSERVACDTPGLKVYTATAYGAENLTTQKRDTVYVRAKAGTPPALSFAVTQDTIEVGEQAELKWQSNATHVIIDQGIGTRGPNGRELVTCATAGWKVFTATAYGENNLTTERSDSLFVRQRVLVPPTLHFEILQDTVKLGEAIDLAWLSNGKRVIIDQGVGVRAPQGNEKVVCPAPGLKIFTATAFGDGSLTTVRKDTVFILAESAEPPTLTFDVVKDTVELGQPAVVNWSSDGQQVFIDQGIGSRGPVGTEEVTFQSLGMKIFTATAFGDANLRTTRRDSIYVKEAPLPPNPLIMLSTTRLVTVNTPATITWHSQNADYVVVDHVNNAGRAGSVEVTFSSPGIRFITATAFNERGWSSATDTIEVVEPVVDPPVDDILVSASVSVRADRGLDGMVQRAAGIFDAPKDGRYRLEAEVWYNSGDAQRNESYYADIEDGIGDTKHPIDRNAGNNRVVPDDPGEPHTRTRGSGIFRLNEGAHMINVYHYALIASTYPRFLNGQISGAESVKIIGFRLVYLGE